MAERKAGSVKPPVIDLKAREADGQFEAAPSADVGPAPAEAVPPQPSAGAPIETPVSVPERETPRATVPKPPRPQARLAMPWSAIAIAAVLGALLGIAGTYLAGNFLALPSRAPAITDPAPALAVQADRLAALEAALPDLQTQAKRTQVSLDATLAQLDGGLAELRRSITETRAAIPAPTPVDLSGIEGRVAALTTRVDALGAGASSADAGALAANLSELQGRLAELAGRLAALNTTVGDNSATVAALQRDVNTTRAALTASTQRLGGAEIGPAVRLPLLLSGLETAFAMGRPYGPELGSLTTLLPDLVVPAGVVSGAAAGLKRDDELSAELEAAMPQMLAAGAGPGSGDWTQDALAWGKALLALRPAGEQPGDTWEAMLSRLEGAINRRDYLAAETLLTGLPPAVLAAAGPFAGDLATHAAADRLVAALRSQALAPAGTETAR